MIVATLNTQLMRSLVRTIRAVLFLFVFVLWANSISTASFAAPIDFHRIVEKEAFLYLIDSKVLTRLGIQLILDSNGSVRGVIFGRAIKGHWSWQGQSLCWQAFLESKELHKDCSIVKISGSTLRFISNNKQNVYADFQIMSSLASNPMTPRPDELDHVNATYALGDSQ